MSWKKWECKYNISKSVEYRKSSVKNTVYSNRAYTRKTKECQINNVMMEIKGLENNDKPNPKLPGGKKWHQSRN